jgi:hypothetical protein
MYIHIKESQAFCLVAYSFEEDPLSLILGVNKEGEEESIYW